MAIDTAERRRAVAALSGAHSFGPGVTPNSSKDAEWRQQAGWGYSGISAGAPVAGGGRILRNNPMMVTLGRMMNR